MSPGCNTVSDGECCLILPFYIAANQVITATGLGLIEACTENNVKWIGYGADQVDLGSDLCITSCIADTGKAIEEVITKVGTDEFGTSWMPGMADDVVFVGTFGDNVPDEVKSAVEDTCEKIKSGEIVVENKETDN